MKPERIPLYFAILKHFADGSVDDANGVIAALSTSYGNCKMLAKRAVDEALATAKENGLLDEAGFDLGEDDSLRIFYCASNYGREMIERYIGQDSDFGDRNN